MARIRFTVRGLVQGVGFRWFVRQQARSLGLAGWVRNEPDGAVRGEAEGPEAALRALGAALQDGPPGSAVAGVETSLTEGQEGLPNPFQIR